TALAGITRIMGAGIMVVAVSWPRADANSRLTCSTAHGGANVSTATADRTIGQVCMGAAGHRIAGIRRANIAVIALALHSSRASPRLTGSPGVAGSAARDILTIGIHAVDQTVCNLTGRRIHTAAVVTHVGVTSGTGVAEANRCR